jgi:multiple sugar transport system ATP-binding protein
MRVSRSRASGRSDPKPGNTGASADAVSAVRYQVVEKAFGSFKALRGLDLALPDRTFLALLGPSGCGKTTALRLLAGLDTPTAGRILIGDRDVTRLQPRDRDIAMVFQTYALYPHMTISDNIAYPLRIRKLSPDACRKKIAQVSAALEIDHLLDRYPRQLSGGQRQRVALARAIVRDPAAFLMDEPLSNLDARLRLTMRGEIKRLCNGLNATTLYVTHDQAEALTMADLIAVMQGGELQQLAPPSEIYDRPANRFVATFVGSPPMNVLRARVDQGGLRVGGVTIPLDATRRDACIAGEVAEIGTRPEELRLVEADAPDALPAEVYVVEPMGHETFVNLRMGDEHLSLRTGRGFAAPVGSVVGVRLEPAKACFFNRAGATVVHRL